MSEANNPIDPNDQPTEPAKPLGKDELERLRKLIREPESEPDSPASLDSQLNPTDGFNAPDPARSRTIGNYKLLQKIGSGGMGEVWMAEQEKPVRRRVALKLIKAGMDNRQVVARFEAERQALAMMDHQNIAKVLDAGTAEDGRPFVVMELVHGIPITKYCDKNKLSIDARLQLFIPVCNAVQHAHQKGIIHRDLKPSNILVTLYDGHPVPKVIDFGLAKALEHQSKLTDKTLFTEFGQVIGTLQYMSPEQAEMNALDIDTRTDIYALGVLLYELLTGSTPIEHATLENQALIKVLESIREQDPPRPSIRLSSAGEAITGISQQRQIDPRKLSQMLKGDLDWIVMKALEKDRTRRYETANSFAADVQRFVSGDAIEARPPSTAYRLKKFARKNRTLVYATSAIASVLLLGTLVSTMFGIAANVASKNFKESERKAVAERVEADQARQQADQARRKAIEEAERATQAEQVAEREATQAIAAKEESEATLARSNFHLARARWKDHRSKEANALLEKIPERFRFLEWNFSRRQFEGSYATMFGHKYGINSVAFSPNGNSFVSGSDDGSAKIWDIANSQPLYTLKGHRGGIECVCYNHDGSVLATGSVDHTIKLWDSATRKEIATLVGHSGKVNCIDFSPDGSLFASGSEDGKIIIWNAPTWKKSMVLEAHKWRVASVDFSPDGRHLASGGWDEFLRIWDVRDGTTKLEVKGYQQIDCVKFSPSGLVIAIAANLTVGHHHAYTLDALTGEKLLQFSGFHERVWCVRFNPDGTKLVIGAEEGAISVWDLATQRNTSNYYGHQAAVKCLDYSPNGEIIVSSSADCTLKAWDTRGPQAGIVVSRATSSRGRGITLDRESNQLSYFQGDDLKVYDLTSYRHVDSATEGKDVARRSRTIWNGDVAFIEGNDVLILENVGETTRRLLGRHNDTIIDLAIAADGMTLATVSKDRTLKLWDLKNRRLSMTHLDFVAEPIRVEFVNDGQDIVCALNNGSLHFVNLKTRKDAILQTGQGTVFDFKKSWDDHTLATNSIWTKSIKLWKNTSEDSPFSTLIGHKEPVNSSVFVPFQHRLVSGGRDRTLRLWDTETGVELLAIDEFYGEVRWVEVTSDANHFLSLDSNDIVMWDTRPSQNTSAIAANGAVSRLIISSDGTKIAAVIDSKSIVVWDNESRKMLRQLDSLSEPIETLAFALSGDEIYASYVNAEKVTERFVWNILSEKFTGVPERPNGFVMRYESVDGRWLVNSFDEQIVLVDQSNSRSDEALKFRRAKSRLDPWSHQEQALRAEEDKNLFAAVFHRTWQLSANPNNALADYHLRGNALALLAELVHTKIANDAPTETVISDDEILAMLTLETRKSIHRRPGDQLTNSEAEEVNGIAWEKVKIPKGPKFNEPSGEGADRASQLDARLRDLLQDHRTEFDLLRLAVAQHPSGAILNTFGVALYREGMDQESIEALNRSVELYKAKNNSSEPSNSAFLALCHHKLGNLDEAKKHRAMFDDAMKDELNKKVEDNLNFQKELNDAFAEAAKE